jgi:hypothetical protein
MGHRSSANHENWSLPARLAADNLKCCPVCDAVNAITNGECFVCRWSGAFEHDPARITSAVEELLVRCPELVEAMSEPAAPQPNLVTRVANWFRARFRRSLDIRA